MLFPLHYHSSRNAPVESSITFPPCPRTTLQAAELLLLRMLHTNPTAHASESLPLRMLLSHSYQILQEFYTLFLTRFKTYKIATPPQTKMTSKRPHYGIGVFKVPSSMCPCLRITPTAPALESLLLRMLLCHSSHAWQHAPPLQPLKHMIRQHFYCACSCVTPYVHGNMLHRYNP